MNTRKIVQIAATGHLENSATQSEYTVFALCEDGSLWWVDNRDKGLGQWTEIPGIPQKARPMTSRSETWTCDVCRAEFSQWAVPVQLRELSDRGIFTCVCRDCAEQPTYLYASRVANVVQACIAREGREVDS